MALAIFDLDNTLLAGDSDHLWGEYLATHGIVDGDHYRRENDRFLRAYEDGSLDIHAFLRFSLQVLAAHDPEQLARWREAFVDECIVPRIAPGAPDLLARHRDAGDHLLIITATNRFVTEPIAQRLGVDDLIATEPAMREGRYTGEVAGTPSFREGKIRRLDQWLANEHHSLTGSRFYSDSHNDIPLLERVDEPIAVDPDARLAATARERGWPIISLR